MLTTNDQNEINREKVFAEALASVLSGLVHDGYSGEEIKRRAQEMRAAWDAVYELDAK